MVDVRVFRLGSNGGLVIAVDGTLDVTAAALVAGELRAGRDVPVIVDLLRSELADLRAVDVVVEAAQTGTTFVAEHTLLRALDLVGARTRRSLAAALG